MGPHNSFSFKVVLLPVGISFAIGIFLVESVLSVESKFEACKPTNCGSDPEISYPFYIHGNGTDYCGHPGFGILCKEGRPIYKTSSASYIIQDITYENQSFRLVNAEIINTDTSCVTQNYSFDRSSVDFIPYHADVVFFYNCIESLTVNYTTSLVHCGSSGINKTYVALVHRGDGLDWNRSVCKSVVAAPVQLEQGEVNQTIRDVDYKKLLKEGFTLKWMGLGKNCPHCQRSGGRCGFEDESSVCFCDDGSHPKHCNDAERETRFYPKCQPFLCGKLGNANFPFTNASRPPLCGSLMVDGCDKNIQKIQLEREGRWYEVLNFYRPDSFGPSTILMHDEVLWEQLFSHDCETFNNLTFPRLPFLSLQIMPNLTLLKCNNTPLSLRDASLLDSIDVPCKDLRIYHTRGFGSLPDDLPPQCSLVQLPGKRSQGNNDAFTMITPNFSLEVQVYPACGACHYGGGECQFKEQNFYCSNAKEESKQLGLKLGLGLGIGCPFLGLILLSFYIYRQRFNKRHNSSNLLSMRNSSDPSSKADLEGDGVYFGIPIFSYTELEEATNNFDSEKELGDGGFGTVYYGKLKDGREVAVKRLYEHNYKRVQQFMNEIEILTRLHHKHLVCLYGCTSRRSRELLLVYEYIPNGTVADHLHGDQANSSPLTWPIRLSIAIETASALAYLHASDIIHRDVKTNNVLLDHNFCVKVADFGLSRLFPNDVTHVSTVPQGTPGYVDPEYHQSYQLTAKSDVYSFGVVLIELISSMPAVDITRHRHEINLSNLAISKIQKSAFDELIDSRLGYNSDEEVKGMTTSVAELAFQCLQQDKEMRPSMENVLQELKIIQGGESMENPEEVHDDSKRSKNTMPPPSPPYCDEAGLLKNVRLPPSPVSVTAKWVSSCSTSTNESG